MDRFVIVIFAFLCILPALSSAQSPGDEIVACVQNCVFECAPACTTNACAQQCGYSCAERCGLHVIDGPGIQTDDTCNGTAPDGHPLIYDGAGCRDKYAAEDYCSLAATCLTCQQRTAYRCIWNGACVPCNSASCTYSCPNGGGVNGGLGGGNNGDGGLGNGGQGNGNGNGGTGNTTYNPPFENPECKKYSTCRDCAIANKQNPYAGDCAWYPDVNKCLDSDENEGDIMFTEEDCLLNRTTPYNGGTWINNSSGNRTPDTEHGTDPCASGTALILLLISAIGFKSI